MKPILFLSVAALAIALGATALTAATRKIELPAETGLFKPGKNAEIANAQCLVCHSVEYVTTQPPFPRTFWATSLKKMREKYGAAITDDQVEPLLDYLTATYGIAGTNPAPPVVINPTPQPASTQTLTGSAIAMKYGCLGCHMVDAKLIGPAYKEIANKYRTETDAKSKVLEQLRKGGSGKWGPVIMPPFPQVTDEETKILIDWILSRK